MARLIGTEVGGKGAPRSRLGLLATLGPGLVTGAADDDPSGIATYSQAGAQFGYGMAWVMVLVALLGTTISPYLFFWQASQEVEERLRRKSQPLYVTPAQAGPELARVRIDTWVGMGYSNLISLFIIFATAATLHANGITDIQSSAQAAEALKPIAGPFAFAVFACGIIGTGLLAIPVLAGSAAYAVCETFDWVEGLDHKPKEAKAFYGVIVLATVLGLGVGFTGIDPIKALYWSAVLNGLLAAPLMATMLLIATDRRIMGSFVLPRSMVATGWLATVAMAAASIAFLIL